MSSNFSSLSDLDLVNLICLRNSESEFAFKEIYARHSSGVHAYCVRVIGDYDNAQDIFQDTFIKFYNHLSGGQEHTNISGFLIKIARNLCLNYKRSQKKTVDINDINLSFDNNKIAEQTELLQLIKTALDLIDPDYKEVFVLREYNGMAYREIACMLSISETNAKTKVFRARQKVREILKPYINELTNI